MEVTVIEGDLLEQEVDAIVNPWNLNLFPWWLLLPHGVSAAIKARAGLEPFRALARKGRLRLGEAVLTEAGRLPYRGIIHVAGIDLLWRASRRSVKSSVENALAICRQNSFNSVAFPIIGSGAGGLDPKQALGFMVDALHDVDYDGTVRIVEYEHRD